MTIRTLSSAMTGALQGLGQQEQQVAKAADALNTAFAAVENALAAPLTDGPEAGADVPVSDGMTGMAEDEVAAPLVSLLVAKTAYKATLKAVQVTADLQRETINALGRRTVVEA